MARSRARSAHGAAAKPGAPAARPARLAARIAAGSAALALLACGAPAAMAAPAQTVPVGLPPSTGPHKLGLIPSVDTAVAPSNSSGKVAHLSLQTASLPASVDLTPDAMPVGNQGQVGSCAAWSSDYAALGYWENKEGIGGGGVEPMYTYSQVDGGADNGSTIEGNLTVDKTQGIDVQSDYYQGNFDYKDQPTTAEKAAAVNWKLSNFTDLAVGQSSSSTVTQDSIETALAAGDPVVIGIPVYNNFFYVTATGNGYYSTTSGAFDGYHAIAALGYNSQGLVIENSWGAGWGDGGYATLSWSFVNSDVFDAVQVGPLVTGMPVATTAPAVTGTPRIGQTLTASTGSWSPTPTSYAYQWERAAADGNAWAEIAGATKSTYVPVTADQGYHLRVLVTATNGTGPGAAESQATNAVAGPVPVDTKVPTVGGTARVGQTLTAGPGTWSPVATSYAYQWQRSTDGGVTWDAITDATASTYVSTSADAGAKDRVVVTASNANGSGVAATSAAFGPLSGTPFATTVPAITGTLAVGHQLTATEGIWSPAGNSYVYQWQRSTNNGATWVNVSGATSATHTTVSADGNARLRVVVTATNGSGSVAAASAATIAVVAGAPAATVKPAVTGSATSGSTLTVGTGTWSPAAATYTYQWERSGNGSTWTAISGATTKTYKATSADVSSVLEVLVTATNAAGSTTTASTVTGAVKA